MQTINEMLRKYTHRYNNEINRFCYPLFKHLGVEHFCYYKITDSGYYISFSSHLPFAEHFFGEQHFLSCPYLLHPSNYNTGVSLEEIVSNDLTKGDRPNFNFTFTMLEKIPDGVQGFALAANYAKPRAEALYINEIPTIQFFIKKFKEHFQKVLYQMDDDLIDLASFIGPHFFNKKVSLTPKISDRDTFFKELGVKDISISNREREVFKLMLKGCTAITISEKLNLSRRTVEHYLESMKNKFDCHSKEELTKKALDFLSMGYLDS